MNKPYRRIGDQAKCPACGTGMDSEAYRCPKCRIYFCFKCRARVGKEDEQYQCANQSCACYGKLLCSACTESVSHTETEWEEDTRGSEMQGAAIGAALTLTLTLVFYFMGILHFTPFTGDVIGFLLVVIIGGVVGRSIGRDLFPKKYLKVQYPIFVRVCAQCEQQVEDI